MPAHLLACGIKGNKVPDLYKKVVESKQSPIAYHTKMFEAVAAAELVIKIK